MRSQTVRILVAAVVVLASAGLSQAKEGRSRFGRQHPRRSEVNRRLGNQQSRINQGLNKGSLTQGQAQQLEGNDKNIKQQEVTDVKANGGYLTRAEKHQLNQEENANSKLIHDEKHPRTGTGGSGTGGSGISGTGTSGTGTSGIGGSGTSGSGTGGEVNRRLANQQSHINQGVKNGELTQGQAQQLEANDSAIKQQGSTDRSANGGKLTRGERRQLNQEENANSKLIRDDKHPAPQ